MRGVRGGRDGLEALNTSSRELTLCVKVGLGMLREEKLARPRFTWLIAARIFSSNADGSLILWWCVLTQL